MADLKTSQLTSLAATPATNDLLMIVDVSDTTMAASGTNKKIASTYFVVSDGNATKVTSGGTIDLGGYSVTVPVAGTVAMLGAANVFTRGLTTTPSGTADYGLNVNMPSGIGSTIRALRWTYDGALRGYAQGDATTNQILLSGFDNGSGAGPNIQIQRNNNASTPAPGFLTLYAGNANIYRIYPDTSGVLRIYTADPTNAVDVGNSGAVIGSQTSHIDFKNIIGDPVWDGDALQCIVEAAENVKRFVYKNGAYGGQEFSGLILSGDELDRYGQDADADHPAGKSLNLITIIGDLLLAVRNLSERVVALEAK